jgi:hypothetical protein
MKKVIVLFLAILIAALAVSPVQAGTQIATPAIDGDKADWAGLVMTITDEMGNSACGATGDIKAVYTAKDTTHVYFMVETYEALIDPNHNNTGVSLDLDYKPGDRWPWNDRTDLNLGFNQDGFWASLDSDGDGTTENVTIDGVQIAWGTNFVEGSIPISALIDFEYFQLASVSIWDSDAFPESTENTTCNYVQINPSQGIEYMYVQRRNNEDGTAGYNKLYFILYDNTQDPTDDMLVKATLYDPDGKEMTYIQPPVSLPDNYLWGNYDNNNGQWNFNSEFKSDIDYSSDFGGDLVPGEYRLHVTTANGDSDEKTFMVSQLVDDGPFVSSKSFRARSDGSGNLIWSWDKPSIDPNLHTSMSAVIGVEDNYDYYAWVTFPSDLNEMTVPKDVLDLLRTKGDNIFIGLHLRINDEFGNNFQRNRSTSVLLAEVPGAQGVDYMYVQRRNYETDQGIAIQNRLYFSMYDHLHSTLGDVLDTATLYDPTGKEIEFTMVPTYEPSNLLMGNYDVNTGHWKLASGFDYFDNGYSGKFAGDLVPGDYKLHVTTLAGGVDEQFFKVSQPVDDAPIIPSSSFQAWKDSSGNLTWKWDVPHDLDPGLNTRISAYMAIDGDDENFFWITVPTHVGSLRIPKATLDLLETTDDKIFLRLYLRINDDEGNNFQRNVSNAVSLEDAMVIPPEGDVNNDGKIGLPEAINALKIVTELNNAP